MQKNRLIILMLLLAMALAACNSQGAGQPTEESAAADAPVATDTPAPTDIPAAMPASQEQIANIVWQWSDLTETEPAGQSVIPDSENYTATFRPDGTASIQADCNRVNWPYTMEGNQITFTALFATTMVACPEGSLEQQFLGFLGRAESAELDDGRLILNLAEGAGFMGFSNGGPAEEQASSASIEQIQNIVWQWQDLTETEPAGQSVVADPENYTVTFLEYGEATIKADCNSLSWTYTAEGNTLTFNTLGATTLALCGEESLDQQFLAFLGQVTSFALDDTGRLELNYGEDAGTMGFNEGGSTETATGEVELTAERIVGVTWRWLSFQDMAEENDITVPDPENYTLRLEADGTAAIKADCNQVSWTYTLDGNSLTFNTLGATTLALCPPGSLDRQYLSLLGSVATWVPGEDGRLVLNLMADGGNMIFSAADEYAENCVTGTITTAEPHDLPENAIIQIQIQDTSLADAEAPVMGEQILEAAGAQFPIAYKVCYEPGDINDALMYGMSVRITDPDGELLFISDTNTPVITQGFPTTDVEIGVVRVNG